MVHGAGELTPEKPHSTGKGKVSSLWGRHGAFLAPQFPRTSVTAPASPVGQDPNSEPAGEQGLEAGGAQQNLLGHSHPAAGWCSAVTLGVRTGV